MRTTLLLLGLTGLTLGLSPVVPSAIAQNTGGGNQGGGNLGGGNLGGGQGGGGQNQQIGGILIDAGGVVRPAPEQRLSTRLLDERREAFAAKAFDGDLRSYSERRCVSLVQLEAECERRLQQGEVIGDDVRHLAGLQRIDYLFVDHEAKDVVIAGPAEGFAPDAQGRFVGLTTGRPPLDLEDLIVVFNSLLGRRSAIGCSIDPEPDRLARMGEYIRANSGASSTAVAARRYRQMGDILGMQKVSVFGVPADSHVALVLVEADFRMKRISLGVEPSGVRGLNSHLSLLKPNGNSIQRWWFVPFYDALYASDDHTAFHLAGQRVQLLAQDELSTLDGERSDAAFTRATTEQFAKMFTQRFPDLAEKSPVFAQLQNVFDLCVVAALLRKEEIPRRIDWPLRTFRDRADELVGRYAVPRQVESASTMRQAGRGMVLGLVGGVTIDSRRIVDQIETQAEPALRLEGLRDAVLIADAPAAHPWWWD